MRTGSSVRIKTSGPLRSRNIKKTITPSFPVVGIGASYGGLDAFHGLLKKLPSQTDMAFVYVQHLSANNKTRLTSDLSQYTDMKVVEIKHNTSIRPNTLYVTPPNKQIRIASGTIELSPLRKNGKKELAINTFFSSLAETYKRKSVGILLSGNAKDGSMGLKAIKNEGGITFAQDDSALFKNMPKSAIAQGFADFVLSPEAIALELTMISKYLGTTSVRRDAGQETETKEDRSDLNDLLELLHQKTGVDFSQYKVATIQRRIGRRMLLKKIKSLRQYNRFLIQNEEELSNLYQDMLINVTSFFREPEVFHFLKSNLIPRLLTEKDDFSPLRIWVAACSTGEEAYSLAISLLELKHKGTTLPPIQIFATDLSEQAISKARQGIYSIQDLQSLSSKQIRLFFSKLDPNTFRIKKEVRELIVFAPHNVLHDPPFSRMDLICCCNLFIYLSPDAQRRTLSAFHYALNPKGFLLLGKSESIESPSAMFSEWSKKHRLYLRKAHSGKKTPVLSSFRTGRNALTHPVQPELKKKESDASRRNLDRMVDSILLTKYVPASLVINHDLEIMHFRGQTSLFLEPYSGKASLNVLKMTRPEIVFELREAIQQAIQNKKPARKAGIEIRMDSATHSIALEVIPLKIEWSAPLLLVLFIPEATGPVSGDVPPNKMNVLARRDQRIKKLEDELSLLRIDLRRIVEEQEDTQKELQAASEEIVSSSEELQSINEELETSKEEVLATNEELTLSNRELESRNKMLMEMHHYSEAIFATIHEPILVLDQKLRIKTANASFFKIFKTGERETLGLSIFELGNRQWNIPALRKLLEELQSTDKSILNFKVIHTFPVIGKKVMMLNAKRIIQKDNQGLLILLAIEDITEQTMDQLQERDLFYENINKYKGRQDSFRTALLAELSKIKNLTLDIQGKKSDQVSVITRQYAEKIEKVAYRIEALLGKQMQVNEN